MFASRSDGDPSGRGSTRLTSGAAAAPEPPATDHSRHASRPSTAAADRCTPPPPRRATALPATAPSPIAAPPSCAHRRDDGMASSGSNVAVASTDTPIPLTAAPGRRRARSWWRHPTRDRSYAKEEALAFVLTYYEQVDAGEYDASWAQAGAGVPRRPQPHVRELCPVLAEHVARTRRACGTFARAAARTKARVRFAVALHHGPAALHVAETDELTLAARGGRRPARDHGATHRVVRANGERAARSAWPNRGSRAKLLQPKLRSGDTWIGYLQRHGSIHQDHHRRRHRT